MPLPEARDRALQRWSLVQACLWLPILALVPWRSDPWPFTPARDPESGAGDATFFGWLLLALLLLSYTLLWRLLRAGRRPADWITLARFAGLLAVATSVALSRGVGFGAWLGALAVVLADLLDGWVARRTGGTEEGAVLDMETDQFTTLVLAMIAFSVAGAGVWTLALPGMKYVFVLAMTALGVRSTDPKPVAGDNRRGRLICAVVLGLLVGALFPPFPPPVSGGLTALAAALLGYSFSSDAAHLWREASARA